MNETKELVYEWPPDILHYEARVLPGLTWIEAIAMALAFLFPVSLLPGIPGFGLGLLAALIGFLCVKRWERLGDTILPVYVIARLLAARRRDTLELPLIMTSEGGAIDVYTLEGEALLTME
jgi:hypothetical protein